MSNSSAAMVDGDRIAGIAARAAEKRRVFERRAARIEFEDKRITRVVGRSWATSRL